MKLFEHPDFEQAIIRAAEHFRPRGLREAVIEKDYSQGRLDAESRKLHFTLDHYSVASRV